ncbi:MAG TPA: type II toxin-antitoxin system VapC family toxin [Opitutaceae bacterium]|nr:type II toxin-antitoxin system VapC family toxin [Opitutaceae bacterium]
MVVTDTSFLFSLYGGDVHTAAARAWAMQTKQPIAITALNRYELGNAIRFAVFRKVISQRHALASLAAFEADLRNGVLQSVSPDLAEMIKEAARLSESHTITGGHRSFDILHVAAARVLKATLFLSFDANQRKLAGTAKVTVGP